MRKILLIFIIFSSLFSYGQKIFSVNYANQADVKVFVVDYSNQADLLVDTEDKAPKTVAIEIAKVLEL